MTTPFKLTSAQVAANRLLGGPVRHIFLRGGSRSGKTFVLVRAIVVRALKTPRSRHGIFRHRFNALKHTIIGDTFPKVMRLCFPQVPYELSRTGWSVTFPNGSEILFHGLDSAERTEKILGLEFATVFLNEASQIGYSARNMLLTRLAQKSALVLKEYIDANPPTMSHWLYALFERGVEPASGKPLPDRPFYATMQINPDANRVNLSPDYIAQLRTLPEREQKRFLRGEYLSAVEGALWTLDPIRREASATETTRETLIAQMKRIVVAVDPSGCSGPQDDRSDEIGIVVAGVDPAGAGHVLADLSARDTPAGWARRVVQAFDQWRADRIVVERNFGGALVEANIRAVRANVPVETVVASRGKFVRAEPVAALYEQGKVVHHGHFSVLEDQLCHFSVNGYQGAHSPDRADALIWGLTELMLSDKTPPCAAWRHTGFSLGR